MQVKRSPRGALTLLYSGFLFPIAPNRSYGMGNGFSPPPVAIMQALLAEGAARPFIGIEAARRGIFAHHEGEERDVAGETREILHTFPICGHTTLRQEAHSVVIYQLKAISLLAVQRIGHIYLII